MRLINLELMQQPVNWVTLPLMVAFGAAILFLVDPFNVKGRTQ